VTVREIAAAAKVNQGLVHEYFGSKDALIKETISHLGRERTTIIDGLDARAAIQALAAFHFEHPAYTRLLGWWLLDGRDASELDLGFTINAGELGRLALADGRQGAVDPLAVSTAINALFLGAVMFQGFTRNPLPREQLEHQLGVIAASLHDWNLMAGGAQ
jgi:AcrR family transcriptional regulator